MKFFYCLSLFTALGLAGCGKEVIEFTPTAPVSIIVVVVPYQPPTPTATP